MGSPRLTRGYSSAFRREQGATRQESDYVPRCDSPNSPHSPRSRHEAAKRASERSLSDRSSPCREPLCLRPGALGLGPAGVDPPRPRPQRRERKGGAGAGPSNGRKATKVLARRRSGTARRAYVEHPVQSVPWSAREGRWPDRPDGRRPRSYPRRVARPHERRGACGQHPKRERQDAQVRPQRRRY